MTTKFDKVLWSQPKWLHYTAAVGLASLALSARHALDPLLGDRSMYGFSMIPVALAAYIGGFGPGMVATALGLFGASYLFASPRGNWDPVNVFIIFTICLFICLVAGRLRNSAQRNSLLALTLDAGSKQTNDILASITDAYYCVNHEWKLVQFNAAFVKLVGTDRVPEEGTNLWELFADRRNTRVYEMLQRVMKDRVAEDLELPRPGTDDWFLVRAFPTFVGVSVFIQDISDRKAMDQRKERMLSDERAARSAAEEAGRMKEEFLAILSHELRTPMTSLLGWATLLNRDNVSPDRLREGLASIEQSAKVQAKMVEELLDISRINAGKLRVEAEILSLPMVVDEALATYRPAAQAKGIELVVVNEIENQMVRGDAGRLHQVLANIFSNAIKFTPRGGTVTLTLFAEGSTACFSVRDTGEGIAPDFLPHVFERFRQGNSGYARRFGGLGLGLSIAKQLIELQGGTIEVKSEGLGKGSEFKVCLPIAPVRQPYSLYEGGGQDAVNLDGARVLIVEDDDSTRMLLRRLIEEHNGVVQDAAHGLAGLAALDEFKPQVILSDIGLPEMDGYAFLETVRARADALAKTPAIALTAFARDSDRSLAGQSGFNAFLTKPVNPTELLRWLDELVKK